MANLNPSLVRHIVWHTAAHGSGQTCHDTSAAQINQWHKDKGWNGIGYHFVVRRDGKREKGRDIKLQGAHVEGINGISVGICFSGHGDICNHTAAQREEGILLTIELLQQFNLVDRFLKSENLGLTVMGHREVNALVSAGMAPKKTDKTCPGRRVDMDEVRAEIRKRLGAPLSSDKDYLYNEASAKKLLESLRGVYAAAAELKIRDDSLKHLNSFRKDEIVDKIIEAAKSGVPV